MELNISNTSDPSTCGGWHLFDSTIGAILHVWRRHGVWQRVEVLQWRGHGLRQQHFVTISRRGARQRNSDNDSGLHVHDFGRRQ